MKYAIIFILLFLSIESVYSQDNQYQTEHEWVNSDDLAISDIHTWNSVALYPNIFERFQPGSNFDVQQYVHPVWNESTAAFVVRVNTQFQYETIKMPDGICYVGVNFFTSNKIRMPIMVIRHRIDVGCGMFNSTLQRVTEYIEYVEQFKSGRLENIN